MNSERLTILVARVSGVLAALLAGWSLAVRPMFAGAASPLHRNITATLAVFMAALLAAMAVALRRRIELRSPAVVVALLAFLGAVILAACFAGNRYAATVRAVEVASWTVLAIVLIDLASTAFRGRVLLAATVATLAVLVADALYQNFVSLPAIRADFDEHVRRLVQAGTLERGMVEAFHKRVFSGDVFATFTTANEFGGFLILLLPVAAAGAWVRLRERKNSWEIALAALLAVVAIAAAGALVLTRSKGACLSLAVALGGWAAVAILSRLHRGAAATAAGVLIACAFFLAPSAPSADNATAPPAPPPHRSILGDSAEVRIEYWKAGLEMWKASPSLGVGPGNFADGYTAFRTPEGSETRHAHNDYLEVAVESGGIGLAAFLAIWVAWWWAMCKRRRTFASESEETPASRRLFAAAVGLAGLGAVAFVLSRFVQTDETRSMLVVGSVAWLGVFLAQIPGVFRKADELSPSGNRLLRRAVGCGAAALLIHFAIDFDFAEPGIVAALAGMMAAGLALREPGRPGRAFAFGSWGQLLVAVILAAPLVLGLVTVVYPLVDMSFAMEEAALVRDEGAAKFAEADKLPKESPEAEKLRGEAQELLGGRYPQLIEEAIGRFPYNPAPWREIARLESGALRHSPEAGRGKMEAVIERAKALSPRDPAPWVLYAQTLWDMTKAADDAGKRSLGDNLASDAAREADGGVARYPAQPQLRLLRARINDRLGLGERAVADYRAALDLAERTSQKELKFKPDEIREILLAVRKIESARPKP